MGLTEKYCAPGRAVEHAGMITHPALRMLKLSQESEPALDIASIAFAIDQHKEPKRLCSRVAIAFGIARSLTRKPSIRQLRLRQPFNAFGYPRLNGRRLLERQKTLNGVGMHMNIDCFAIAERKGAIRPLITEQ